MVFALGAFGQTTFAVDSDTKESNDQIAPETPIVDQGENQSIPTQTPGQSSQIKDQEQEKIKAPVKKNTDDKKAIGAELSIQRRSLVANTVHEILQISDRNGGIGQQVKIIAQSQNQNQEKIEIGLQKAQNRSGLAKFFIGPNYREINNGKKLVEQNQEKISQLRQIKTKLTNQGDQQKLTEQIVLLEQANEETQNELSDTGRGFSLLGWMFRLVAK